LVSFSFYDRVKRLLKTTGSKLIQSQEVIVNEYVDVSKENQCFLTDLEVGLAGLSAMIGHLNKN